MSEYGTIESKALEFFENYRNFVFVGKTGVGCYHDDLQYGPMAPWTPYNPYTVNSAAWNQLTAAPRELLFPRHPFESGSMSGNFRLWDYIMTAGITKVRQSASLVATTTMRNLQSLRDGGLNDYWTSNMKHAFSFDVPDSPFIVDLRCTPEGRRIVDAAHGLAHYRCNSRLYDTTSGVKLHGRLTDEFHKACAELALGYLTGIPVDIASKGVDVPMAYGLSVRPGTTLGFDIEMPVLNVPIRADMSNTVNHTLAYVLAVVQVGHDPHRFVNRSGDPNYPRDWWAYQPIRVFIAGWETAAYVYAQDLVFADSQYWHPRDHQCGFGVHVKDLMPSTTLEYYTALGAKHWPADQRYVDVKTWLDSDSCAHLVDMTPPLPCNTCMHTYNDFSGGLCPPRGPRPYLKQHMTKDWKSYFKNFAFANKLVTKAKSIMFTAGSFRAAMAARRRNFKTVINEARRKLNATKKW